MKNKGVSAMPSSYVIIMTVVYALLAAIFVDIANGAEDSGIVNGVDKDNKASAQELVETTCKSPCPPNAEEMCIQMCA
ncbi:MAG TPA: hypothetical protein VFM28_11700 [Nitrososphaeraceae archaeon]|nr:hypothetical protein [Nitrososphaeraceae archaeon]